MARPTKLELLQRFFPEVMDKAGSKGDKEAAMKVNTLACEAVLADLLNLYDKGVAKLGLGVLCLRLQKGAQESSYISLEDFRADRDMAGQNSSTDLEAFLTDVIDEIERTSPEKAALVMLLDNSSAQLFPISKEYPARSIQALMEEYVA
jgi:hypothetical protein